ncbi:MAG: hypothetical protein ACKVWV_02525 [Planctomycetota bacterium]
MPAHELSTQGVSDPSSALRVSLASVVSREAFVDPLRALERRDAKDAGAEALTLAPPPSVAPAGQHDFVGRFGGNGGPGGNFDWEIGTPSGGGTEVLVLDTTFAQILNSSQTAVQTVVNGNVDVRNLTIWPNGVLRIQGPNPCTIRASGKVAVHGKVIIKGGNASGIATFNTAHIPDPGAAGHGGGGRGGVGSPLTTASDPKGGDGFGAFQVPGDGGLGGESGWCTGAIGCRRPGGGGGGVFGHASLRRSPNPNGCPEQVAIGLDAEQGFDGSPQPPPAGHISGSALGGVGQQPQGGAAGTSPFVDLNDLGGPKRRNDFFGTMVTASGERIVGELLRPWAGAGGGGGGDSVQVPASSPTFPQVPYDVNTNQKGSGGGGGGGSIAIYARGDIQLVGFGSIDASGGTGGGGENTNGVNRVGGGSGGGSGGHIVLQTLSKIDMAEVVAPGAAEYPSASVGGLFALGGQGGEGAGGLGGAHGNGIPTSPLLDALPPDSYPNTGGGVSDGPCAFSTNVVGNAAPTIVVQCAGGDGGPGLIQLHVLSLADILPPAGVELFRVVKPTPIGATPNNVNTPSAWDQLLPIGGRVPKRL